MNEQLFNDLVKLGFEPALNSLVKDFTPRYRVIVSYHEGMENNIVISNNYYDASDKNDWVKNFPVFAGTCNNINEFKNIISIVNVEDVAKESLK